MIATPLRRTKALGTITMKPAELPRVYPAFLKTVTKTSDSPPVSSNKISLELLDDPDILAQSGLPGSSRNQKHPTVIVLRAVIQFPPEHLKSRGSRFFIKFKIQTERRLRRARMDPLSFLSLPPPLSPSPSFPFLFFVCVYADQLQINNESFTPDWPDAGQQQQLNFSTKEGKALRIGVKSKRATLRPLLPATSNQAPGVSSSRLGCIQ